MDLLTNGQLTLEFSSSFCFTPDLIRTLCRVPSSGQSRRHRGGILSLLSHCSFYGFSKEKQKWEEESSLQVVLHPGPSLESAQSRGLKAGCLGGSTKAKVLLGGWAGWPVPGCRCGVFGPWCSKASLEASVTTGRTDSTMKISPPAPDPTCFLNLCCFGRENAT